MRSLIEIRNYLEGERKAQANIPQQDRNLYPAVLATDNAYAALRQSLTTEQFIEALKREPLDSTEQEVVREYHMQVQIIIDYAEESTTGGSSR